jgi:hypothetical protein
MSNKTLVSVFPSRDEAEAAAERLAASGLDRSGLIIQSDLPQDGGDDGLTGPDYAAPILPGRPVYPAVPLPGAVNPVLGVPRPNQPATAIGEGSAASDRAVARELAHWLASEGDAREYAEQVRAGGALLVARCDEEQLANALGVLGPKAPR